MPERLQRQARGADGWALMARVRRYDTGTLKPAEKRPNGWLRVEGRSAKVGILEYDQPDGTVRRELVLPDDLFNPASMASASLVPVTHRHPEALLDDRTVRAHQVGTVGEALRPEGDFLVAPMMITDAAVVADVETGNTGLSWGYDCNLDPPDPTLFTKWGQHDNIQRQRIYNHLACGVVPRAGAQARIRLDSAGNACDPFAADNTSMVASPHSPAAPAAQQPENRMPAQIRIGELRFDSTEAAGPLIQQEIDRVVRDLTARLDASDKAKLAAEKLATDATTKLDGATKRFTGKLKLVKGHLDAMMKRDVMCDECGGGKQIDGQKCPSCDGAGVHSARDAIKAMPVPEGKPHPEEDAAMMEEECDAAVPPRESPAEEGLEKAANNEHSDAARAKAKQRADGRVVARQRRADGLGRHADRRAIARASLVVTAQRFLGTEEKLDAKGDLDIKRAVLGKVAPHLEGVDKMDAAGVEVLYTAEVKRADAASPQLPSFSPSDALRVGLLPAPAPAAAPRRIDGSTFANDAANAKQNAWQRPKAK
jgi:hypothetical protein